MHRKGLQKLLSICTFCWGWTCSLNRFYVSEILEFSQIFELFLSKLFHLTAWNHSLFYRAYTMYFCPSVHVYNRVVYVWELHGNVTASWFNLPDATGKNPRSSWQIQLATRLNNDWLMVPSHVSKVALIVWKTGKKSTWFRKDLTTSRTFVHTMLLNWN